MSRVTRSVARRDQSNTGNIDTAAVQSSEPVYSIPHPKKLPEPVDYLTEQQFSKDLLTLRKAERRLLLSKRDSLRAPKSSSNSFNLLNDLRSQSDGELLAQATAATLVFAGESAGTATCISPGGLILTCAHCIAESEDEYKASGERWLLFASGDAVKAKCIAWDPMRDLALLQITAAFRTPPPAPSGNEFPFARIATRPPKSPARLICIGHPGSEDFEADQPGVATGYDVLHLSEGRFRGLAKGQDPQDNSEIGALMHDCWTYWGHSGAPLMARATGDLVGLHSSWDDQTGMRRGVAWDAIKSFLADHTVFDQPLP